MTHRWYDDGGLVPWYQVQFTDPINQDRLEYELEAPDAQEAEIQAVETFAADRDVCVFDVLGCVTDVVLIRRYS